MSLAIYIQDLSNIQLFSLKHNYIDQRVMDIYNSIGLGNSHFEHFTGPYFLLLTSLESTMRR